MKEEGPGIIERGPYIVEHAVFAEKNTENKEKEKEEEEEEEEEKENKGNRENNLRVFILARVVTVDM